MKLLATLPVLLILTVPAPAQDDGRFGLMISSLVPAVRQANADGAGGAALASAEQSRMETIKYLCCSSLGSSLKDASRQINRFSVDVYLDNDEQFQIYSQIADEERRTSTLKPQVVKSLRARNINYFVFVKYVPLGTEDVRIEASLARLLDDERAVVVSSEQAVSRMDDPDFKPLGLKLFNGLLKDKGLEPMRRMRLVVCDFTSSGSAGEDSILVMTMIRAGIEGDTRFRNLWYVAQIEEGSCKTEAAPGEDILILTGTLQRLDKTISVIVQVKHHAEIVASQPQSFSIEDITKQDPGKVLKKLNDGLQLQFEKWSPPL